MTDIQFAKEHMGEYFQYKGVAVRIVGFEFLGSYENIIVARRPVSRYMIGWSQTLLSPDDKILVELDPEERLYYANMDDLKEIEK